MFCWDKSKRSINGVPRMYTKEVRLDFSDKQFLKIRGCPIDRSVLENIQTNQNFLNSKIDNN